MQPNAITIETIVNVPVDKAWKFWNEPEHVLRWNNASPDWHTPRAENDLRTGGKFVYRMEAKDGSFGFDFGGTYDEVKPNEFIAYTMDDGRQVKVTFTPMLDKTLVSETFDPENQNSLDLQRQGWQSILDNYKRHCESFA